jgi:N utilization substance protein B
MSNLATESLRRKRIARVAAVQALYNRSVLSSQLSAEKLATHVSEQWRDSIAEKEEDWGDEAPEQALLQEVISGVMKNEADIDATLRTVIKENWRPERMSPVMLNILRCAIYELQHHTERKDAILLDEYVSIAAGFFDDPELGFIHSALQRLAQSLRAPDMAEKDA